MTLLQNKTVKKLSKQELSQDYVFNKELPERMIYSYGQANNSQSLQEFLCDYLIEESFQECQLLYDIKFFEALSRVEDLEDDWEEALREELLSEQAIESYTRSQEINKRSDLKYDLYGFEKIDGVLYYITQEIAYDLTDVPFQCVVVSSVAYYLKNNENLTYLAWDNAFDFLVDPRFHEELLDLLKKEDLTQNSRIHMLFGFRKALKDQEEVNTILNPPKIYNFDILFAILQWIGIDDEKAHELAKNCVHTNSFQDIINYLSHLIKLENGVA